MASVPLMGSEPRRTFTWKDYTFLVLVALPLGLLTSFTAGYMALRVGFFIGGAVFAGVVGSAVVPRYGREGVHGANFIQTFANSVSSFGGAITALHLAMLWRGIPAPEAWKFTLFFVCVGMFGVGVGMCYTPLLVDEWKLTFPSGKAVADILRALTDPVLRRKSVVQLGASGLIGMFSGRGLLPVPDAWGFSAATLGAGLIVSAFITLPAFWMAYLGHLLTPYLVSIGWLEQGQEFRKGVGFLIALAMMLGAAVVQLAPGIWAQVMKLKGSEIKHRPEGWMIGWAVAWAAILVFVSVAIMGLPIGYALLGIALSVVFCLVNGIGSGISDNNPISSAFVVTILLIAATKLVNPVFGVLAASIVLISVAPGVDMQQERSTGSRLGTNRRTQFVFNALGVVVGVPVAVWVSEFFVKAFPVILNADTAKAAHWSCAMTVKFAGSLELLNKLPVYKLHALELGLVIGVVLEVLRKTLRRKSADGSLRFMKNPVGNFVLEVFILPSPFAMGFGGFVDLLTAAWFGIGGVLSSLAQQASKVVPALRPPAEAEDMSPVSLVGGGLIGGEAIGILWLGATLIMQMKH